MSHSQKLLKDSDKSLQDPRFERERNASATGSQKGKRRKLRTDKSGREFSVPPSQGNDLGSFEKFSD